MTLDSQQQEIVEYQGKRAMVLAGPGCGKTRILTDRIIHAAAVHGVGYEQMLCLTFTNRAAREMSSRIEAKLGHIPDGLFVGNLHRFCIRFLYANNIISPDTTILDEDDQELFLSQELGLGNARWRNEVLSTAAELYMQDHDFPQSVHRRFHFRVTDKHVKAARLYEQFKQKNNLIDFDDCLLWTYSALLNPESDTMQFSSYSWVQIDEVQDLTPLQLAIIDCITSDPQSTVLYLGDEQQAIFEFLGAGGRALDIVKRRCNGRVFRLQRNYRSPASLVKLCNTFAAFQLDIDPAFLPDANNDLQYTDGLLIGHTNEATHNLTVIAQARRYLALYPDETVAILTHTNAEAESLSRELHGHDLEHMLISRNDCFKSTAFKTVFAHISLALNPILPLQWARVLYQTECVKQLSKATELVYLMGKNALTPADFMQPDSETTVSRTMEALNNEDIVVLDTETSGLNIFEDDVIQFAAIKISKGKLINNSEISILIHTDRQLPELLHGGIVNPMIEVYHNGEQLSRAEGLQAIAEYIGDCRVCGHNVDFDISILRNNFERCSIAAPPGLGKPAIDTLLLSKLLFPLQRKYNLNTLLTLFHIEGENSHKALDDVMATWSLLQYLKPYVTDKYSHQQEFLSNKVITDIALKLRKNYMPLYRQTQAILHDSKVYEENTLKGALSLTYNYLQSRLYINIIPRWDSMLRLFESLITTPSTEKRLREQLNAHIHEIRTFNEGDLISNCLVPERLTVMTIHKAKGLEMDNVIVYNAKYTSWGDPASRVRVYYVAFSRAKKRLTVFYSDSIDEAVGSVKHLFKTIPPVEIKYMAMQENFLGNNGFPQMLP